jgi:threonine/homoserine/homoserine lactone efflux protein
MQSKTISRLLSPFEQFVHSESAGGLALIAASLFAWTSSPWVSGYFTLGEMSPSTGYEDRRFEKPSALRVTVLAAALGLLGCRVSPGAG